jgi:hypothetical protein
MSHYDLVNDEAPPRERRARVRRRVLLTGKIAHPQSGLSADCVIRDLSPDGARVTVGPEPMAADAFLIIVKDGVAHQAAAAWRAGGEAGLRFQTTSDLTGDPGPHLRAIQRIWVELAPR